MASRTIPERSGLPQICYGMTPLKTLHPIDGSLTIKNLCAEASITIPIDEWREARQYCGLVNNLDVLSDAWLIRIQFVPEMWFPVNNHSNCYFIVANESVDFQTGRVTLQLQEASALLKNELLMVAPAPGYDTSTGRLAVWAKVNRSWTVATVPSMTADSIPISQICTWGINGLETEITNTSGATVKLLAGTNFDSTIGALTMDGWQPNFDSFYSALNYFLTIYPDRIMRVVYEDNGWYLFIGGPLTVCNYWRYGREVIQASFSANNSGISNRGVNVSSAGSVTEYRNGVHTVNRFDRSVFYTPNYEAGLVTEMKKYIDLNYNPVETIQCTGYPDADSYPVLGQTFAMTCGDYYVESKSEWHGEDYPLLASGRITQIQYPSLWGDPARVVITAGKYQSMESEMQKLRNDQRLAGKYSASKTGR